MAHCQEDIQRNLNELAAKATHMGQKINNNKTKSILNAVVMTIAAGIRYEGTDVEDVRRFKYLGSTITQDGNCDREVLLRIAYAGGAFSQLKNIWRCRYYSQKLKLRLFWINVLSVLLYGCEFWSLSKNAEKRLLGFENNCLRRILAVHWTDRVTKA